MFTRAAAIESSSIRSVCTQHAKTHRGATGDMLFRHGTGTGCSTFHGALPVRNSKQSSPSRKALDLVGVIVDSDPADSLKSALSTQRPRDAPGRSFCDEPVCVHRNKRPGGAARDPPAAAAVLMFTALLLCSCPSRPHSRTRKHSCRKVTAAGRDLEAPERRWAPVGPGI